MANRPANIRISAQFPFPAAVQGGAPIVLTKLNGVWTVSLNVAALGAQVPPVGNYPTDYLLFYDAAAQTFFKMSLTSLVAGVAAIAQQARTQRNVNATPIIVGANDQIITCSINANATCLLPTAASRNGIPLTFKDTGFATAHPIVFTPNGAETIDGAATATINVNRQEITFMPFNDGVNTGWFIS